MRRFWLYLPFIFCLMLLLSGPPVSAQSLDSLRAGGAVGERFDGLLVLRDAGASASVKALVEDVNGKRRAIYSQRGQQQGVPPEQVGRVYARQIMQQAPSGTWFQNENGSWTRK